MNKKQSGPVVLVVFACVLLGAAGFAFVSRHVSIGVHTSISCPPEVRSLRDALRRGISAEDLAERLRSDPALIHGPLEGYQGILFETEILCSVELSRVALAAGADPLATVSVQDSPNSAALGLFFGSGTISPVQFAVFLDSPALFDAMAERGIHLDASTTAKLLALSQRFKSTTEEAIERVQQR